MEDTDSHNAEKIGPKVSVVVPLAPGEKFLDSCVKELGRLPDDFELVLSSSSNIDLDDGRFVIAKADGPGRACALNCGAKKATGDWLWFVHADTRLFGGIEQALLAGMKKHPGSLLYFGIDYYDGKLLHKINSLGADFRSAFFGAPFGDQAFCVPRQLHKAIGDFREDADYGEDHLYARAARRKGARLVRLAGKVGTSARKHIDQGWLSLTARYQWMWITQALGDR